jgi:hypothetical protein
VPDRRRLGEKIARRITPSPALPKISSRWFTSRFTRGPRGAADPYSLETQTWPLDEGIADKAKALKNALRKLQKPMQELVAAFRKKLANDEGLLDPDTRRRLDAVNQSLEKRSPP